MKNRKALLVIDMQKGSFTALTPRHDTDGVVQRINLMAEAFRTYGLPVFFIQHDGTHSGNFVPHTTEWELLDDLKVEAGDILIDKYANDVFYRSELQSQLDQCLVDELIISGCATDFCIESTVQSALTRDYKITVVEDGHTTGERPHLKAVQVIEHYNWVWKNMIPTKGTVNVMPHRAILDELAGTSR
ncbi:isochorismatase family protein [Emticicia sp. 21SJ11W-3]|uniref:isochorismatase family protein n=1 Tax=Emticicia sp. 21SJ11W-3 TaxID=2916755 RepID=UPI00209E5B80|nr:isochorismatase family protein [Emticicia sp. 21SJ11W-3]UTA66621.1 isochorismatase family protein [Emticicia sp. 21SJ11W-3]